jgi:hypothetical protein
MRIPDVVQRNRPVAAFFAALITLACTEASLIAYDSGTLGPTDRGQRILLRGPASLVRAIRDMARVATVATGLLVATELRREWDDYVNNLLGGGAVRQ